MLPTELYWMYGISSLSLGMFLLAVLIFAVWRYLTLRASEGRIVHSVALFALLANAIVLESTHVIYAFSGPIILLVYVVTLEYLLRYFFPWLSPTLAKDRSSS